MHHYRAHANLYLNVTGQKLTDIVFTSVLSYICVIFKALTPFSIHFNCMEISVFSRKVMRFEQYEGE